MKQFKQYIGLLIILLTSLGAIAQTPDSSDDPVNMYGILYYQPHGLDGSPYLMNEWSKGSVTLITRQTTTSILLKFNIISNDLIFYNEKFKNLYTADRNTVTSFILNQGQSNQMNFIRYSGTEVGYRLKNNEFVQVVYDGKLKFLAKYSASISDANDLSSKDKVFPKNYFFIQNGERVDEIRLNLRSIIKLYPDRKHEIKKAASQMRFRKQSISDMSQLIKGLE